MITYIIKSSLCLMLLWAFYKLFLEKENIHFVKRFYLLFSLVFACIMPLITLTYQIEVIPEPEAVSETIIPLMMDSDPIIIEESINYVPIILWSIYGIGVLIFGFRFIRNINDISRKIRANERLKEPSHINVLLSNSIIPHTFLTYIFVPKKEFQKRNIPEEVLLHEKTHVLQKHTLDILFVEILQVFFWFNPLFVFIKKSIKLNHEFLADHNVLRHQFSIQNYVDLLLNYPNSSNQVVLSSPINYSLTKKRLQMMTKEFSKKRTMLKLVTLVPILSLCVLFFNNEIVAKEVEQPINEITNPESIPNIQKESSLIVLKDKGESSSINENQNSFQDRVTKEMMEEYNAWAKDLNFKIKNNKQITIRKNELNRMQYIYRNMTPDQQKRVAKYPDIDIPPPPPVPEALKGEKSNIPPPPPPPAPIVKKGQKSNIPPPPPPKVKKGEKSDIPPPPPPAPEAPSPNNGSYIDVKFSEHANLSEEEKKEYVESAEATLAAERAEIEREKANLREEVAMLRSEEARQQLEYAQVLAMETAENSQKQALESAEMARIMALEASQEARLQAEVQAELAEAKSEVRYRKAMKYAELQSRKAEKEMRKAEMEARKKTLKMERESKKAMRTAEMNVRKAEMEARKSAREAELKARKSERALRTAETRSPERLIENMAKKDAEFYYRGKQISAKQALKLVEDSNNNLSIDASTKNGKSKVILKD